MEDDEDAELEEDEDNVNVEDEVNVEDNTELEEEEEDLPAPRETYKDGLISHDELSPTPDEIGGTNG